MQGLKRLPAGMVHLVMNMIERAAHCLTSALFPPQRANGVDAAAALKVTTRANVASGLDRTPSAAGQLQADQPAILMTQQRMLENRMTDTASQNSGELRHQLALEREIFEGFDNLGLSPRATPARSVAAAADDPGSKVTLRGVRLVDHSA